MWTTSSERDEFFMKGHVQAVQSHQEAEGPLDLESEQDYMK